MKYIFNDFVFDSDQLVLYKNNEVVACRHTEAKLLALFLSDPQRVFSKDDILEQVWVGKVVSEQAVFQNISLLRTLCGEDAIKTFSKRGYQWQLEVNAYVGPQSPSPSPSNKLAGTRDLSGRSHHRLLAVISMAFVLVIALAGAWYWRLTLNGPVATTVTLLPLLVEHNDQQIRGINQDVVELIQVGISQTKSFQPIQANEIKYYDDFWYTPQKYFNRIVQQTQSDVVMMGLIGKRNNKISIRYTLKSKKGSWNAEHRASNVPELVKMLEAHIALILRSGFLDVNTSDANLINAQLKIINQQAPDDLVVLAQLASSENQNSNTNNAILLAGELASKAQLQGDVTAEGEGYIIAARAYIAQSLYPEAKNNLQKAFELYGAQKDYRALNKVQQTYAILAFAEQDYESFKTSQLAAIELAQQAQDPLMEVENSTYLSVVANKFGETSDRQFYLDHAESVLDQTRQSREQYGIIYFYTGMYAETPAIAEKNYRKVLAVLSADEEWWERERAREHLTAILINQSRWQEALDLFPGKSLTAGEELMVMKVHAAQQAWGQAEIHGLNAFKVANLTAQKELALDAALALLNLYKALHQVEKVHIYKQFIQKEAGAFPYWSKINKANIEEYVLEKIR